MGKITAKIVSYILHPMLMPTFGLVIIFNSGTYISMEHEVVRRFIYLITFVSTFIFPLLFIPFFVYRNMISSFAMDHHKERVFPLLLSSIFYFFGYFLIQWRSLSAFCEAFLLASFVSVVSILLISIFWKVSAHMAGIGGLTGLVIAISLICQVNLQFFLILVFLMGGLIGFARLRLNAHNPLQILTGFVVGFLVVFITVLLYINY